MNLAVTSGKFLQGGNWPRPDKHASIVAENILRTKAHDSILISHRNQILTYVGARVFGRSQDRRPLDNTPENNCTRLWTCYHLGHAEDGFPLCGMYATRDASPPPNEIARGQNCRR